MSAGREDVYESEATGEEDLNSKFARPESTNPEQVELETGEESDVSLYQSIIRDQIEPHTWVHIDMEAAKKRFAGRIVNVNNVDFSDSISKKRREAYGSSAYVLEVIGSATIQETPEQKYNRIIYEIGELTEQVKQEEENKSEFLTENALKELIDELKAVAVSKKSGSEEVILKETKISSIQQAKPRQDLSVSSLDSRIRRLESILGPLSESTPPLIDAVEDLKYRTDALNATYLDGLDSRLNSLISKLDTVESRKSQGDNGELLAKVDSLYELMNKWDTACNNLPLNIKRVHALRALHEQASHFGEKLSQLVGIREQMEKAAAESRFSIQEMQGQTKEEIAALMKSIATLEARLK